MIRWIKFTSVSLKPLIHEIDCRLRSDLLMKNSKNFWFYNIYGASCAEVELDVLTGNYIVNRVDLLYDCGNRSALR